MTALHPAPVLAGQALRQLMRQHAAGVAVITSRSESGEPVGFCATSLCSVSLRPPTVSFAVGLGSASGRAWRTAGNGIVHLLRSDQVDVAAAFGRSGPAKFDGLVGWRSGPEGLPLLAGVLGWMVVHCRSRLVVGDHLLVVADVRAVTVEPGRGPLVHHDGDYHELPPARGRRDAC